MKNFLTLLSIAATVFVACDKENETPGQKIDPAELVEVTFDVFAKKSTISDVEKASTKTEIKEDGTVLWSVGDKVAVFYEVNGETGSSEPRLLRRNIKADRLRFHYRESSCSLHIGTVRRNPQPFCGLSVRRVSRLRGRQDQCLCS